MTHIRQLPLWKILAPALILILLLLFPSSAAAHGGGEREPASLAGPLAIGLLIFGLAVIAAVGMILYSRRTEPPPSEKSSQFEKLTGPRGYVGKMRLFSRNARLYMIHVVGMDVIYGTWEVIFNLYLLEIGFNITFIGTRIIARSLASAAAAIPAGIISDKIGRKISFLAGDGIGAVMALVSISTANPTLILSAAVISGVFGALHNVAEPAFMAENSENYERVHLFSVSGGTRTAAAIIGASLAGLVPLTLASAENSSLVEIYRLVVYLGIVGWFASLIPAIMLKRTSLPLQTSVSKRTGLFANIEHPQIIWRLTAPEVILGFGAGFAIPLMNVFFHQSINSPEVEIGATFAAGQAFLVVATFLAPIIAVRLGKIKSIAFTRAASIPFILLLALSTDIGSEIGSVFSLAAFAYIARITMMNMASPVRSAFGMEILSPQERGTQVGIQLALASLVSGVATFLGARMMDAGDFQTPFFLMAFFYSISSFLFWRFFKGHEEELIQEVPISKPKVVRGGE